MDFSFDEDQRELRAIVAAFLERHATSQAVRAAAEGDGFAAEQWGRLTGEMELTGLAVAPERGGAGASFVEVGIAIEELGRTLLPVPYLSTVTAAAVLSHICSDEDAGPLLERIAGGAARRWHRGVLPTLAPYMAAKIGSTAAGRWWTARWWSSTARPPRS